MTASPTRPLFVGRRDANEMAQAIDEALGVGEIGATGVSPMGEGRFDRGLIPYGESADRKEKTGP
ncbi:MAG: hypothetical protein ACTHM0_01505 [Sphingomonas sp.]